MLLTSAPVAAKGIATPALPLDLHVLSLSLAFILSQDQTLRCCILSFSFPRIMKTQRRFVHRAPAPPPSQAALGLAVLVSLPVFERNLDVDSGFPFPCLCTVNFLIANISMISASRVSRPLPKRRQKKPLTQFMHLVSRKALQNYSRRSYPPNISGRKSLK